LIEIGSKTAEKNYAQTNRHYENNGHLAVNQKQTHSKLNTPILPYGGIKSEVTTAHKVGII